MSCRVNVVTRDVDISTILTTLLCTLQKAHVVIKPSLACLAQLSGNTAHR